MKTIARSARTVVRHIAFRVLLSVASVALTISLLLGVAINTAFMQPSAPLSRSENLAAMVATMAYSIPILYGVAILLPQSRVWVRWLGASIVFVLAPSFLVALLASGYVTIASEEQNWMVLWMLSAIAYWFLLRPIQVLWPHTTSNKEGEQGADGDAEAAV